MKVEVVYALPERQDLVALDLAPGATAGDAVAASGLLERHALPDPCRLALGISGVRVAPGRRLAEGDRVEILRPLATDPAEARRRRARARPR
jgi:putative ubiquitin-RnfH superfamily antitoxin RatB of RatAB toxin-antitoxin module